MTFGIVISGRVTAHWSMGVLVYGAITDGYLDCARWREVVAILAQCEGDCVEELIREIELAKTLMTNELFANLVNGHCKEWRDFSHRDMVSLKEFREIEGRYIGEANRKVAKRLHTKIRRQEFNSVRSDLFLKMIEAGVAVKCAAIGCEETSYLTIDHLLPLSRGGSDHLSNLQFLCRSHNSKKGDSHPIVTREEGAA